MLLIYAFKEKRASLRVDDGSTDLDKRITRYAHDLAGLRYVVELFCQIQQADLVPYDILCSMQHEGYLSYGSDW